MKNKYFVNQKKKELLDLEEVLLDSKNRQEERLEIILTDKKIKNAEKILAAILLLLSLRAAQLQIIKGDFYAEISKSNYTRTLSIKSSRGIIYDKNFRQIVFNVPVFDLVITPNDFFKDKNGINEKIDRLARIAKIEKNDLEKKIEKTDKRSYEPYLILENISKEEALILEEKIKKLDGVILEKNSVRDYIDSNYFSHIIGYSGRITAEELRKNPDYFFNDTIGKNGIELSYKKELRGKYGKQEIEVDSFGRKIKVIKKEEPVSGHNLILNIDSGLQKKITDELNAIIKKLKTEAGAAAVALDPRNGEVLALVSLPSYDNNLFAKGIGNENYEKLIKDKSNPFFNRAISGEYPPGSSIKPVIGAAALQERIITPQKMIMAGAAIYVGNYKFLDWKYHGMINLVEAIAQSSNVYFYTIGGGYGDISGLGIEKMKSYADLFGLGNILGIDIPNEKEGFFPDKDWKEKVKGEKWYIGDTYHAAIGQGDVLVTPLQIASYTAAISNGGKLFQPRIVNRIMDSEGNLIQKIEPKIIRENFIDSENIKWIQLGMRENVVSGSGRALADLPFKAAGKTGTAQYALNSKTHAWYTSYAPFENPEIVLTVLVEGGGEGHAAAVPAAKEVLRWYFEKLTN